MCRLSDKKANWYLERGLAALEEEKTIRLTFEPNGIGDTNLYMLEDKESICVVCGVDHDLSFHHVVPYGYRKHFPLEWKTHSSHDNLLLCERCHHLYENSAWELKKSLQHVYAPISPSDKEAKIARSRAVRAAFALVRDAMPSSSVTNQREKFEQKRKNIPDHRIKELYDLVEPYVPNLDTGTIIAFVKDAKKNPDRQDPIVDCEAVARVVVSRGEDEIRTFIERWRSHFIETTQPQFLSDNWDIYWHKED
jgi:hypothetical protein